MARIKFNSKKAAKNLTDKIDKVSRSSSLTKEIGDFLVNRVQIQARRGKPLNDEGKFDKLEPSTIARRKKLAELNPTDRAYRGSKSNLTFTGQLVDAIAFRRKAKDLFELFVENTPRTPYLGLRGKNLKTPTNQQIDKDLRKGVGKKKKTFELFTTKALKKSDKILNRVRNIYVRFLRKAIRKG